MNTLPDKGEQACCDQRGANVSQPR